MQILFLNHNTAYRGGTFYRAFDVARHLVQRGHSVTLLTISVDRRWGFTSEQQQGVQLVHTPDLFWGVGRTGWDPWDLINRVAYVRRPAWDIIHAWDSRPVVSLPALFARRCSRSRNARLVMDWCDWWGRGGTQTERPRKWMTLASPVETFFEEAFRPHADGTTVISGALCARAMGLGIPRQKIRLLRQGCDPTGQLADLGTRSRSEARRRLGLPVAHPLAVSVGALHQSDAALLFDALRDLFVRRPHCHFALIGRHGVRVPEDLRQSGCLIETGFISQSALQDYMLACDALVTALADTTASRARWPSKVNPFLALGRATVITRVGDLPDLLAREGAAIVTAAVSADIANGVCALFDDPNLRDDIERRARAVATGVLAWPALVADLEGFYVTLRAEAQGL